MVNGHISGRVAQIELAESNWTRCAHGRWGPSWRHLPRASRAWPASTIQIPIRCRRRSHHVATELPEGHIQSESRSQGAASQGSEHRARLVRQTELGLGCQASWTSLSASNRWIPSFWEQSRARQASRTNVRCLLSTLLVDACTMGSAGWRSDLTWGVPSRHLLEIRPASALTRSTHDPSNCLTSGSGRSFTQTTQQRE